MLFTVNVTAFSKTILLAVFLHHETISLDNYRTIGADSIRARASQVVLVVKNPPADAGDTRDVGSIPGSGKSPGKGNGNPLQYSSWKMPRTEEPDWLQYMVLQRVEHDGTTEHTFMHTQAQHRECSHNIISIYICFKWVSSRMNLVARN